MSQSASEIPKALQNTLGEPSSNNNNNNNDKNNNVNSHNHDIDMNNSNNNNNNNTNSNSHSSVTHHRPSVSFNLSIEQEQKADQLQQQQQQAQVQASFVNSGTPSPNLRSTGESHNAPLISSPHGGSDLLPNMGSVGTSSPSDTLNNNNNNNNDLLTFGQQHQQLQQQKQRRKSSIAPSPSPYFQMAPEFNPMSTLGTTTSSRRNTAHDLMNASATSGIGGEGSGPLPPSLMQQSTTNFFNPLMSVRDGSGGIPVPAAAQLKNANNNNKNNDDNNNNNNDKSSSKKPVFTSAGGEEVTSHYFHHDTFALTTALYINSALFATAIARIALVMNSESMSLAPSSSANIWIVVANGFACLVFIYYLYVEISGFVSSHRRSSRRENRRRRRIIRDKKRKERAIARKKYLQQQAKTDTSDDIITHTPPQPSSSASPASNRTNILTQRKNLLSGATAGNDIEMTAQDGSGGGIDGRGGKALPDFLESDDDDDNITDESDEDRADYYRQLAAMSSKNNNNSSSKNNHNLQQQQQEQLSRRRRDRNGGKNDNGKNYSGVGGAGSSSSSTLSALDLEHIERRRDLLDTVWVVAWASTLVTVYCEGGSGGGLTAMLIPLFIVMAPAFRVSVIPVIITIILSVGLVIGLFVSHFPGAVFRRFELPIAPAEVCVNFVVTVAVAAWVSHRRTREVDQLSDHYMTMLKIVASTTEHLLLLRTSEAVTSLNRIPTELFTAPQEKRVLNELLVFTQFLHELGSYFPQHIATAARNRLLMNSDVKLFAALGLNATELGFGAGANPMTTMMNENNLNANTSHHLSGGVFSSGDAGQNNNNNNLQTRSRANRNTAVTFEDDDDNNDNMLGDDDDEFEQRVEEESFSAMRKRMCTVMQITILDYPAYDINKAAQASLWLCENALERIEAQDGIVDILTPSYIVASFNFHKPCAVRHSRLACECALSISAALTHSDAAASQNLLFSITIDTTQNVGGTVGTGFKRAEAMAGEGLDTISRLVPLTNILAVPILITERVQRNLGRQFETIPVDVAEIRWFQTERQKQITLYELRGSRPRNNMNSTTLTDLFASAFSHFRRGDLNLAEENLVKWEKELQKAGGMLTAETADKSQARRLKAICYMYRKNANLVFPKPFARRNVNWQLFVGEMPNPTSRSQAAGGAKNDPAFLSPLRERLKWQRQQITMLNGDTNMAASLQIQHDNNHDQLETTFRKIKDQQDAKVQEVTGGLMDFFMIASDDDDDDLGANNNNNNADAASPSYQSFTTGDMNKGGDANVSAGLGMNPDVSVGGGGGGGMASTVPTEIVDIEEDRWTRSSEPIGSGGFSEVYLGLGGHGMLVAMKLFMLESAKSSISELRGEVTLLSKLKHENIVSYVSCAFTSSHFIIIMEYVSGGSLHSLLRQFGPLPLQALKKYLFDILRGLQYLHSKGSVHCDVKPHNALLHNDGVVKLTDFGSTVNQMTHKKKKKSKNSNNANNNNDDDDDNNNNNNNNDDGGGLTVRGTPHYMSPEAAKNKISPASDIWSVGITVMELYTGMLPWTEKQMKTSPQNFVLQLSDDENPPQPVISDQLHEDVRDFVKRCLVHDPKQRSTIEELLVSPLLAV